MPSDRCGLLRLGALLYLAPTVPAIQHWQREPETSRPTCLNADAQRVVEPWNRGTRDIVAEFLWFAEGHGAPQHPPGFPKVLEGRLRIGQAGCKWLDTHKEKKKDAAG